MVLFDDFVIYDPSCFSFLRYKWCINSLEHCMAGPERFTNIKQLKIQDTSDTLRIYFVGITNKFCKNNKYILFAYEMFFVTTEFALRFSQGCRSWKTKSWTFKKHSKLNNLLNSVKNMRMRIEDDLDADSDPNENVLLVDVWCFRWLMADDYL